MSENVQTRDLVETWVDDRARWVIDLLRCGCDIAVMGSPGIGKTSVINRAREELEHLDPDLFERVWWFTEGAAPPQVKRDRADLFVAEVYGSPNNPSLAPRGFVVVPLLPILSERGVRKALQ
ncbi:hypothetical protein ACWDUM_02675 [Rhodococcus sp. NPDC003322]